MAREKPILVVTCLLLVLSIALALECPNREDVAPCTCEDRFSSGAEIECDAIDDEQLSKVAGKLRGRTVDSFTIEDSKLGSIPHDVFKGVRLSELKIKKSTLVALTDRGAAFTGLEHYLEKLFISGCVLESEWDWTVLRRLKKLKSLSIIDTLHLGTVGTGIMKASVPSLESVYLPGNNISFVADGAFDSYKNLRSLTLYSNKIENVKRSMLPNPASELRLLDLVDNLIEQFPEDMFTNMPNLLTLYIGKNKILVLNEKTFSPVWEQLRTFSTYGNPLSCDCSLSWLLEKKTPNGLYGECASPADLKGKKLTKLDSKDFVCYV